MHSPEILAPAGNRPSFLAALAAGADAVYCGLKHFSARMEADNFSVSELAGLSRLARSRKVRVYLALNTMIKPDEADKVGRLLDRLKRQVGPDAVIFSDPGLVDIARQVGLECELHLSTLGNFHLAPGMAVLRRLGVSRVVLPRELSIDEIRQMAIPGGGVGLEVFVHGALCYGISGRCYWSSFLGGKSGLRGRCVQPCRRVYSYRGSKGYFFSCRDLGLDVLAKTLLDQRYADIRELAWALAEVLRRQVEGIDAPYVQIDEANLPGNPGDAMWAHEVVNRVLEGVRGDRGMHLCFGNYGGQAIQRGVWKDMIAFINNVQVSHVVLEFARRGYEELPLFRELRGDIELGVGVIDIKDNEIETPETVARRIERAAEILGADRVRWVHPDCGFWMLPRTVADGKMHALVAGRDLFIGAKPKR